MPCSLVVFTILKQAFRNKLTGRFNRFNNEIIPLDSGMETYLCQRLQTIIGSYSNHSSPSTCWLYLRNIAFLTQTTEKINGSSILRIQSTYHSCKPKNTHLLNDPTPLLHSYKMWRRNLKSQFTNVAAQPPRSFPKNSIYYSSQYIKPRKHPDGSSSIYGCLADIYYRTTTFMQLLLFLIPFS